MVLAGLALAAMVTMEPAALDDLMQQARVPGLTIAVVGQDESIAWAGVADADTGKPVSAETLFEAASLTKPLLGLWAVQLANEGIIDLDRPMAERFTFSRIRDEERFARLTPRMVLTHRSGMPNWAADPTKPEEAGPIPFNQPPGEIFGYSGEGFMLLQAYLEQESGESFGDFFEQRLAPLMPSSSLTGIPDGMVPAWGHDGAGRKGEGARPLRASAFPAAAFSLLTTAADYAAMIDNLCRAGGTLNDLKPALFSTPARLEDDPRLAWGLGWGMQLEPDGPLAFHWGDNEQFRSFVAFDPESCDGVVYMTNGMGGLQLIEALAEPVVGDLDPVIDWLAYGRPGDEKSED